MLRQVKFFLNSFFSGPQAPFFLADDNGHFERNGLEVHFTEGESLAYSVPVLAAGSYDVAYGDMNTLIEMKSVDPDSSPLAVWAMHNRSPYTIAIDADGLVATPADLKGRKLVSHPEDAAWKLFPEFCAATGLDISTVSVEASDLGHDEMVPLMREGRWEGIFGFVNTVRAHTIEAGLDPDRVLRHLEFRHYLPELYGGAVMVTRDFAQKNPEAVRGLLAAINLGLKDAIADPDAAIAAVARRNPRIDVKANRARLLGTLALEMADPEGGRIGIGDADDARILAGANLITKAKGLSRVPKPSEVFDRQFLPPFGERVTSLAERP
ncbi:ABC transporter substrate-binding protein [Pseudaminobacter soli (ex Li et al. 2025)]|uniref:ABC transporter substrate-binding protein n=1 Tax=Pseudaminobacter soli (ex Li et al. 2025) TaxID=1295366 RepID=A0A2P7S3U8_9HYPH|nr:ABC transporter substrate-binding protein [Mesorhizobium soli]PSJ57137.1 ABC transporter substrate-binding protein [Mesorhizobium soli]